MAGCTVANPTGAITYFHKDSVGNPVIATEFASQIVWKRTFRPKATVSVTQFGEKAAEAEKNHICSIPNLLARHKRSVQQSIVQPRTT